MKKYFTKILVVMFVTFLSSSTPIFSKNVYAISKFQNKLTYVHKVDTFMNIDEYGKKLTKENAVESILNIETCELSDSNLSLSGMLEYSDGTSKTFEITGNLKLGLDNSDLIVGNLSDKNENFEIKYFSIDRNPNKKIVIDNDKLKNNYNKPLLKLYMMEKGTRNFTTIEIYNPDFINIEQIYNNSTGFNKADIKDHSWIPKTFKPTNTTEIASAPIKTMLLSDTNSVVKDVTYSTHYMAGYIEWYERIYLRFTLEGPDSLVTQGLFTTKLEVLSERTWAPNYPNEIYNDSNFSIGQYNETKVDSFLQPNDVFAMINWGSYTNRAYSVNMDIGWSYSLPGTGLGFALSYANSTNQLDGNSKTFTNTANSLTRQAGVALEPGYILNAPGHYLDAGFFVNHFNGSPVGYKTFNVKWTYEVYNALNYSDPSLGLKTLTSSKSYYSN